MPDSATRDFPGYHGRRRPFPFCGRIIEAYYTNPELNTVCVTYKEDSENTPSGEERAYDFYMEVDETDARFQALLKEYSYGWSNLKTALNRQLSRSKQSSGN